MRKGLGLLFSNGFCEDATGIFILFWETQILGWQATSVQIKSLFDGSVFFFGRLGLGKTWGVSQWEASSAFVI